ncbi:MAG: hypothetical protein JO247_00850, partial [Chloroflexi bacterium]|nr:hypothetical protein [Chloroflexota bacterium]
MADALSRARLGFSLAFARPLAAPSALAAAVAMFLLLAWSGQLLQRYPSG